MTTTNQLIRDFLDFALKHTPQQQVRLCYRTTNPLTLISDIYIPIELDSPHLSRLIEHFNIKYQLKKKIIEAEAKEKRPRKCIYSTGTDWHAPYTHACNCPKKDFIRPVYCIDVEGCPQYSEKTKSSDGVKMVFIGNLNPRTHDISVYETDTIFDKLYQCPSCKAIHIVTDDEMRKAPWIEDVPKFDVICRHTGTVELVERR